MSAVSKPRPVGSAEETQEALEKIMQFAESIGYTVDGYVIPKNAPYFSVDPDGTWTCPHCGAVEDELLNVELGGGAFSMEYLDEADVREILPTVGDDAVAGWEGTSGDPESQTIGYQCPNCYGWVNPNNEIVWS